MSAASGQSAGQARDSSDRLGLAADSLGGRHHRRPGLQSHKIGLVTQAVGMSESPGDRRGQTDGATQQSGFHLLMLGFQTKASTDLQQLRHRDYVAPELTAELVHQTLDRVRGLQLPEGRGGFLQPLFP